MHCSLISFLIERWIGVFHFSRFVCLSLTFQVSIALAFFGLVGKNKQFFTFRSGVFGFSIPSPRWKEYAHTHTSFILFEVVAEKPKYMRFHWQCMFHDSSHLFRCLMILIRWIFALLFVFNMWRPEHGKCIVKRDAYHVRCVSECISIHAGEKVMKVVWGANEIEIRLLKHKFVFHIYDRYFVSVFSFDHHDSMIIRD